MTLIAETPNETLRRRLNENADRLAAEFADSFDRETVRRIVFETYEAYFAGTPITEYVPLFVVRRVREQLANERRRRAEAS